MKGSFRVLAAAAALILLLTGCAKTHKTAITAHRGYWKCEEANNAQNSIASFRLAQEYGLWGSEFDVRLTKDDVVVVNHDSDINGKVVRDHNYDDIKDELLSNGEKICTLEQYFEQGKKSGKTVLVLEIKPMGNDAADEVLLNKCIEALKDCGLFNPKRVIFISFSLYICKRIAELCPEFTNQYLEGDLAPSELKAMGINGIDYEQGVFFEHPEWVKEAHDLGMSVNVWTVNSEEDMRRLADLGVDCITTNEPALCRKVLGAAELRKTRKSREIK